MGLLPATVVTLRAEIGEFQTKMSAARGELDKMQAKGESSMSSFGTFGKSSFMAVGAAAVALGTEAIHLADTFEISHAQLTASLAANGLSFDAWSAQIGTADKAAEKLGYTNAETEGALARLETMVKNPTVALKDLSVAEDVARARGIDLTTASNMVGKASEGTYTALVKLGVVTKDQAASFTSGAQAVDYLGKAFGGQAAAFSDTFAGKLETRKATSEDLGKNLGLVLIPIIEEVASALADGLHWIEDHRAGLIELAKVVTAVAVPALGMWLIAQREVMAQAIADFMLNAAASVTVFATTMAAAAVEVYAALGPVGLLFAGVAILEVAFSNVSKAASDAGNTIGQTFIQQTKGVADPVATLTDQVAKLKQANLDLVDAGLKNSGTNKDLALQMGKGSDAYKQNAAEVKALEGQLRTLHDAQIGSAQATAAGAGIDALDTETKKQLDQAIKDTTAAVKDATTAASDYFDAAVSADRADIDWANKTDALTLALKKSHDSISLTNADGRSARGIVDDLVAATDKNIVAVMKSGVTADQMRPLIQGYVDKLDATATAAGMTKTQIDQLNTQYKLTPAQITTQINLVGVATAQQQIATMRAGLYALGISAAQVEAQIAAATNPHGPGGGVGASAAAGVITPHAAGGTFSAGERMLVGERGPELVSFGTGGMVTPNNQLGVAGAGGGASGGGDIVLQIDGQTIARILAPLVAPGVRDALLRRGRSMTSVGLA